MLEEENKKNYKNYNDKENTSEIQNIYEELNLLNLKLDKREDDIKNIISEKDIIISEMNKKIKEQEIIIHSNNDKINNLNKQLKDINKQINYFKNFEDKIKKFLNYDEIQSESIKEKINYENSLIEKNLNTLEYEKINNEDINSSEENSSEDENIFYDEYEDILDEENIIVNKKTKHKNKNKKNNKNKKEEKDNLIINKDKQKMNDEHFILIGKDVSQLEKNSKEKIYKFESEIIKSEEQFYILEKSIQNILPNIKLNKINFDLIVKHNKFPLNIKTVKENEDSLLNKNLLFIVETINNDIICLFLNKSFLPKNSFYLFLNDNKIFYYRNKLRNKIQKNEIYRDEESHIRFKYNKKTIENIGELKNFFFEGYFRFVNNLELSKFKIIEIYQILYE